MIPQHYSIEPNRLYAGEYPGDRNPNIARSKILSLVNLGISTFIDLTSSHDQMEPYENVLADLEKETGRRLRRISLPVPDMRVPDSAETMETIMKEVRDSLVSDPAVYIHCWGGIGRTGTVVGCWLRECGLEAEDALKRVQQLYSNHMPKVLIHPESPQTREQKDYIRNWNPDR